MHPSHNFDRRCLLLKVDKHKLQFFDRKCGPLCYTADKLQYKSCVGITQINFTFFLTSASRVTKSVMFIKAGVAIWTANSSFTVALAEFIAFVIDGSRWVAKTFYAALCFTFPVTRLQNINESKINDNVLHIQSNGRLLHWCLYVSTHLLNKNYVFV